MVISNPLLSEMLVHEKNLKAFFSTIKILCNNSEKLHCIVQAQNITSTLLACCSFLKGANTYDQTLFFCTT